MIPGPPHAPLDLMYMSVLVGIGFMSSQIFLLPPSPQSIVFFLRQPTSASAVSPVLYPTYMTASSNTESCAAPVSLYVWVLPPCTPPTPLTAAPLYLSVLEGGGWICYLGPLTHLRLCLPAVYVCPSRGGGGGRVDTWSPSCTPGFDVYVRPGGDWIDMVIRPFLDYVDNLSLVLVI